MKSHACGFVISILVTVPVNVTGRLTSNSAANEWCGAAGAAARRHATPTTPNDTRFMTGLLRILDRLTVGERLWTWATMAKA
jgi:hypothetical protein